MPSSYHPYGPSVPLSLELGSPRPRNLQDMVAIGKSMRVQVAGGVVEINRAPEDTEPLTIEEGATLGLTALGVGHAIIDSFIDEDRLVILSGLYDKVGVKPNTRSDAPLIGGSHSRGYLTGVASPDLKRLDADLGADFVRLANLLPTGLPSAELGKLLGITAPAIHSRANAILGTLDIRAVDRKPAAIVTAAIAAKIRPKTRSAQTRMPTIDQLVEKHSDRFNSEPRQSLSWAPFGRRTDIELNYKDQLPGVKRPDLDHSRLYSFKVRGSTVKVNRESARHLRVAKSNVISMITNKEVSHLVIHMLAKSPAEAQAILGPDSEPLKEALRKLSPRSRGDLGPAIMSAFQGGLIKTHTTPVLGVSHAERGRLHEFAVKLGSGEQIEDSLLPKFERLQEVIRVSAPTLVLLGLADIFGKPQLMDKWGLHLTDLRSGSDEG